MFRCNVCNELSDTNKVPCCQQRNYRSIKLIHLLVRNEENIRICACTGKPISGGIGVGAIYAVNCPGCRKHYEEHIRPKIQVSSSGN